MDENEKPWGYKWRSSRLLIISSITVALFTETFLYGFLTPILGYMLEERLNIDTSQTQRYTTLLLTGYGFTGLVSAPIIAYLAEKTPGQKIPLLISLCGCLVGTLMVAFASSVWVLFLGRFLQSLAGSGTCVVGLALLAKSVSKGNLGSTMGIAMSFISAGIVLGPTMSGVLLQLFGYWASWSLPIAILALDTIARLAIIEPETDVSASHAKSGTGSSYTTSTSTENQILDETTTLISDTPSTSDQIDVKGNTDTKPEYEYYKTVLSDARVLTSLANILFVSSLMAGLSNTLPVHLREVFGWKSLLISMMFFCLQVPNIILSGPAGWLRDRLGLRIPTTMGWIAIAPLLLLLGAPGDALFPWAGSGAAGKPLFTCSIIALGTVFPLVRGVGAVQLAYVVNDLESQDPHNFEANKSNLRVFSMTEIGFNLGMMLGPLVTGSLFETIGFFYMTLVLATISFIQAAASWRWLDQPLTQEEESAAVC